MTQLRRLPMCGMCGAGSTRLVQTLKGTFLLCEKCEPPAQAGAPIATEPMEPPKKTIIVVDRGPDATYVGRAGQGEDGYFGNPFRVGERCARCGAHHATPYSTLGCFALYFKARVERDAEFRARVLALAGHKLWCPGRCLVRGSACHASIIADWVNATTSPRFKLPPLPARKFSLPPLPARKRVVVAPQPVQRKPPVVCAIDYTYAENESGNEQECVVAECSECEHVEQSWGHGDKSVRRCLVLMGQNCPEGANNFYVLESD